MKRLEVIRRYTGVPLEVASLIDSYHFSLPTLCRRLIRLHRVISYWSIARHLYTYIVPLSQSLTLKRIGIMDAFFAAPVNTRHLYSRKCYGHYWLEYESFDYLLRYRHELHFIYRLFGFALNWVYEVPRNEIYLFKAECKRRGNPYF